MTALVKYLPLGGVLDGFFCGNAGVTKTYLGELVDSSNEASAFGKLSLTFSLGLFIGPMLGGTLSNPTVLAQMNTKGYSILL